jgi:hypothetical protein
MKNKILLTAFLLISVFTYAEKILVPMDSTQTDHLRAYGIVFDQLKNKHEVNWLLNYRGGSFLAESSDQVITLCRERGVSFELLDTKAENLLNKTIANKTNNMSSVKMVRAPRIAVHSAISSGVWSDPVVLVFQYAGIPFDTVSDEQILQGALMNYDFLHVHHEDFTGQHGRYYSGYRNAAWYQDEVKTEQELSDRLGYPKVSLMKLDVAKHIRTFIENGGSFFAMCSATDSYDVALASEGVDIADTMYDGDTYDNNANAELKYDNCLAFQNFSVKLNPWVFECADIDTYGSRGQQGISSGNDYFTLHDFSATDATESCMLTQDHVRTIYGFWGQTTAFNEQFIKPDVALLATTDIDHEARYIHGDLGKGMWTFLGGHDPEDYMHRVEEGPTDVSKFKNSPGYRLILNNALFASTKTDQQEVVTVSSYPNPASDVLHVSYNGTENNSALTFSVYDANGKEVLTQAFTAGNTTQDVDITSLAPGVYIWRLNAADAPLHSETFTIVR